MIMANRYAGSIHIDGFSRMNMFKDTKTLNEEQMSYFGKNIDKAWFRDKEPDTVAFSARGPVNYKDISEVSKKLGSKELTFSMHDTENFTPEITTVWQDGVNTRAFQREFNQKTMRFENTLEVIATHPKYSSDKSNNDDIGAKFEDINLIPDDELPF